MKIKNNVTFLTLLTCLLTAPLTFSGELPRMEAPHIDTSAQTEPAKRNPIDERPWWRKTLDSIKNAPGKLRSLVKKKPTPLQPAAPVLEAEKNPSSLPTVVGEPVTAHEFTEEQLKAIHEQGEDLNFEKPTPQRRPTFERTKRINLEETNGFIENVNKEIAKKNPYLTKDARKEIEKRKATLLVQERIIKDLLDRNEFLDFEVEFRTLQRLGKKITDVLDDPNSYTDIKEQNRTKLRVFIKKLSDNSFELKMQAERAQKLETQQQQFTTSQDSVAQFLEKKKLIPESLVGTSAEIAYKDYARQVKIIERQLYSSSRPAPVSEKSLTDLKALQTALVKQLGFFKFKRYKPLPPSKEATYVNGQPGPGHWTMKPQRIKK